MRASPSASFRITPVGPYSLAQGIRFLEEFTPAAYAGAEEGHLHLAFVLDGTQDSIGVCVRTDGADVLGEVFGTVPIDAVRHQVARILSLDVDGSEFEEVGRRDDVIGGLQRRYPGLRPVAFYSPYEAACWALISHRIRITYAAKLKERMAAALGVEVNVHGEGRFAFPSPEVLLGLQEFPGLTDTKVRYLHGAAQSALDGLLDADRLRALPESEALEQLQTIPGVGPFSSGLILLRGAAAPDGFASAEPRLARAVALAYGLDEPPTTDQLRLIAERWKPYRTWATLLLRTNLEEETHEISGHAG
jgi:DNA-3-methyladenine glycosylase II